FFNDVLMADRAAQASSGASIKVSGTRRWLFIAAAALCFLLLVFFTISFFKNHAVESELREAALGIPSSESTGGDLASVAALNKLGILRQNLEKLADWHVNGHPFFAGFFLYVGDDVYKEARPIYCQRFNQLLMRQTQGYMVA